ncbi:uncharacterized protein [Panulirus ornatus]|uniref:uncharacterized protein n=1 Tax=Panulirus ornatus TaxID=150431 RepID=UPI003A89C632
MKRFVLLCIFMGILCLAEGRDSDDARIAASRTTKTAIVLTTSTTVTPFTCALATNAAACQRRRYRRYSDLLLQDYGQERQDIDGSLSEVVENEPSDDRDPRLAIRIISTVSSTFTVTSTSINSAITFSLSFFCTVNGAMLPPACG